MPNLSSLILYQPNLYSFSYKASDILIYRSCHEIAYAFRLDNTQNRLQRLMSQRSKPRSFMIFASAVDHKRAIYLFRKNNSHQLMRIGDTPERYSFVGKFSNVVRHAVRAADHERYLALSRERQCFDVIREFFARYYLPRNI